MHKKHRDDYEAVRALPGEAEMDQILRYEQGTAEAPRISAEATEGPGASERLGFKRSQGCCRECDQHLRQARP
jgi:hypothetical protein